MHYIAEPGRAPSLFSCDWTVPSGDDGRQWQSLPSVSITASGPPWITRH